MTRHPKTAQRVLAIDPTTRGFAFAIFEGPRSLVGWGLKHVPATAGLERKSGDRETQGILMLARLLAQYEPDLLVVEDCKARGNRRRERARRFIDVVAEFATKQKIPVRRIARKKVLQSFGEGATKQKIASVLAAHFPELHTRLPKVRKAWMSEDERINVFDAAGLAIAYFGRDRLASQSSDRLAA